MSEPNLVCVACGTNEVGLGDPMCVYCWLGDDTESQLEGEAMCVGCGCSDMRACADGCSWLDVNHADGTGVCSQCPQHLAAWRFEQAEPAALQRKQWLQQAEQDREAVRSTPSVAHKLPP